MNGSPSQRAHAVWTSGLILLLALTGCAVAAERADVTLTEDGKRIVLANGVISATIDTPSARVVSIQFDGHEMVSRDRQSYFSFAGGASYEQPSRCGYSVVKREADVVDISCKRTYAPGDKQAWDIDIHYVLKRGDSGLYVYAILDHPTDYPEAGFGEWRTVWWMPHDEQGNELMEKICVDSVRNWVMPSKDSKPEVQGIKEVVKLTEGPWAGKMDCKYAYASEYAQLRTWGYASDKNHCGVWFVLGGVDYFNDGPTKQDLTSAAANMLLHLNMNHYNGGGMTVRHGEAYRKVYGPWMMLMTNEQTADANWTAAKKRVEVEKAQWPYTWLRDPGYAAETRGSASGRLVVHDPLKPKTSAANAWVGLAQSEAKSGKDWQFQANDFQYWTRADAQGSFKIPAVRPGTYTLYAFTDGAVGEYSQDNVTIQPKANTALKTVTWNVDHHGKRIAWEIGTPDRTAAEFHHGHTDYWYPYLFQKFSSEYPNPLIYDVSKKNYSTAINYAQGGYEVDGHAVPWTWVLKFNLDQAPTGDATLTLAFAGSHGAKIDVEVNSDKNAAPLAVVDPPNQGGNALLREGVHAKYGVSYVTIPAGLLHAGANTISLTQTQTKSTGNHVMYDYLNLELP